MADADQPTIADLLPPGQGPGSQPSRSNDPTVNSLATAASRWRSLMRQRLFEPQDPRAQSPKLCFQKGIRETG
ncbi:hypothetical protein E4U28_003627 [Claviceps purpurea]|nr:hypothetical protein E4U28_003627 [Claviceps purpurea]